MNIYIMYTYVEVIKLLLFYYNIHQNIFKILTLKVSS